MIRKNQGIFVSYEPEEGSDTKWLCGIGEVGQLGPLLLFFGGNFLNESSEAIDFNVKVAFTHRFRADIVISRVGPIVGPYF